jgi:hypothetical protein
MTVLESLIFLALFVPAVAIACVALAEARREPGRNRPTVFDTAGGGCGWGGCGGGGAGDGGG